MEHLTDRQIQELLAGAGPGGDQDALRAHLEECDACRARFDQAASTWALLGEWDVDAGDRDVLAAVLDQVTAPPPVIERSDPRWWQRPAMRIAAAVLLAVGIGHALGRWSGGGAVVVVDEAAVVESLYLDTFALPSPAGLAGAVLDTEPEATEDPS